MMSFVKETQRIMFGVLLAFFIVGMTASYWAIVGADTILLRNDNPRLVLQERQIDRGTIYDIHNTPLAETIMNTDGTRQRIYHVPATFGTTGYYSLRYGVGGLEATYNTILRGDTLPTTIERFFAIDLLHSDPVGSDVQLTLHADLQETIVRAMADRNGAVIVMRGDDSAIMSLISQPAISPNTLDTDWEQLADDESKPFFNRATQGQYQPGSIMHHILMTAAILSNTNFDIVTADGDAPIMIDETIIQCAITPPVPDITLAMAYAYGCPRPFRLLIQANQQALPPILDSFALNQIPDTLDFVADVPLTDTTQDIDLNELAPENDASSNDLVAMLLGQGGYTVNPLAVAMMNTAIINDGIAKYPYLLNQIREPEGNWILSSRPEKARALMTDRSARRLRDLWVQNVVQVEAFAPLRIEGLTVGAHIARASSGDTEIAWFNGFIQADDGQAFVITIALEDSDVSEAIQMASIIFKELYAN